MVRTSDAAALSGTYPWCMPHVVIIGGGFGGLAAAKALKKADVELTLIDRCNYHLFQPLLYQVATSGLSTTEVATPIRAVLAKQANARVLLDEACEVDLDSRQVMLCDDRPLDYDFLIVAAGAKTNYFGHAEWSRFGLGLKDLDDAIEIRRRVLLAFEAAEREPDEAIRRKLLSFVVIGGGPTGVELAGAMAELARFTLSRDFRNARPQEARVRLVEALPTILPTFHESLAAKAAKHLSHMGVEILTEKMVSSIDEEGVHFDDELIEAGTVMWATGVIARPLAKTLGAELDRGGRVIVDADCSIPGHPEAFVIGDMACFHGDEGKPLPGLAPVAMQQGRSVAKNIVRTLEAKPREPFVYRDKGVMATVGRSKAVLERGRLRLDGILAWMAWLFVHIVYLIGFRNRLAVLADWTYSYFTYKRGARLITGRRMEPGLPAEVVQPSEIELDARRKRAEEERARHAERHPELQQEEPPPLHH